MFCMDIYVIKTKHSTKISDDILKKFEKKPFSMKRKWREHCFSYFMLDKILDDIYKIENRKIVFIDNKPYLDNKDKFFSLSHSNDYLVISISENNCGIDIEKIKNRPYKKIAERMKFKSNSLEDFYYDWTLYEARYKLNSHEHCKKQLKIDEYIITAVSQNSNEDFKIHNFSI